MWIPLYPKSKYKLVKLGKKFKALAIELAPSSLILFLVAEYPPKLKYKFYKLTNFSKADPQALAPPSFIELYYNYTFKEVKVTKLAKA